MTGNRLFGRLVSIALQKRMHDLHIPVGQRRGRDHQTVNTPSNVELCRAPCDVELGRTELHRFIPLVFCAGENDDVASHFGCKLDGKVTKTAETHDTDAVGGSNVRLQRVKHGSTRTHERGCFCGRDRLGNVKEKVGFPDGVRGKRALVQVSLAVQGALSTIHFVSAQTLVTVHATVVQVAPSSAIPAGCE